VTNLTTCALVCAEVGGADRPRLADDPWTPMGLLRIAKIVPWRILLGGENAN